MATVDPTLSSASPVERFNARIRRNPLVAALILAGTIVIALASFTDAASKLVALFHRQTPAAARTTLAQMNLPYTAQTFIASAAAGDATAVKLFVAAGMDPNTTTDREGSALGNAAYQGRDEVVSALLAAGARVSGDADHPSALGSAAVGGHDAIVRLLLDHKPAPDAAAIDEAFVMAASRATYPQKRNYEGMRLLAARGADVRKLAPTVWADVFDRAIAEDDATEVTKALLDLGADADGDASEAGKAVTRRTPLMGAAAEGYRSTVDLLLAHGARVDTTWDRPEVDDRGWTALMLAVRQARAEVAAALIAKGADVERLNSAGHNALLLAAMNGDPPTFEAVLAHAVRLDDARDRDGETALMLLATGRRWPGEAADVHPDAIAALLDKGARVDVRDKTGRTALMLAAESGSAAAVQLLLAHGARLDDRDAGGRRAIDYARKGGGAVAANAVMRLLQRG